LRLLKRLMKNQKNSKAFSLFEVVVSIIILGIIATSFPLILESVTKSAKTVTKEKTILNEMSLMSMIIPFYFDEKNTEDDNFYKDLNASGGDSELYNNYNYMYNTYARIGKKEFYNNELRSGSIDDVSNIGKDSGENDISKYDDIDDFDNYKEEISGHILKVKVFYIDDSANYSDENINFTYDYTTKKNKTNIKLIKITSDNNITLYYPTCNIGASKFLSLGEISR
jgi:prepilin-type N-terminal cleavage/methylation domain-containing protein